MPRRKRKLNLIPIKQPSKKTIAGKKRQLNVAFADEMRVQPPTKKSKQETTNNTKNVNSNNKIRSNSNTNNKITPNNSRRNSNTNNKVASNSNNIKRSNIFCLNKHNTNNNTKHTAMLESTYYSLKNLNEFSLEFSVKIRIIFISQQSKFISQGSQKISKYAIIMDKTGIMMKLIFYDSEVFKFSDLTCGKVYEISNSVVRTSNFPVFGEYEMVCRYNTTIKQLPELYGNVYHLIITHIHTIT